MHQYMTKILKNGLTCITYQNTALNSVTIGLYINAGLMHENKSNYGISHLLEHLYFRKMSDLSQRDLYYKMESMGASLRGTTYKNCICFRITVLSEYLESAMEIISKILTHTQWNQGDIAKEKKVVLNQIKHQTWESFYERLDRRYFKETGLGKPIMGRESTIQRLTQDKINYYKDYFVNSANSCLVLTGNFDEKMADNIFQKIVGLKSENGLLMKDIIVDRFGKRHEEDVVIEDTDWDSSEVCISFDIPEDTDIHAVRMLCTIIGEGVGSRLPLLLREELCLTNEVYSQMEEYNGMKRMCIKFTVDNNDLKNSLEHTFVSLADLRKRVNQREIDCAKIFFTKNRRLLYDDSKELNFVLGYYGYINRGAMMDIEEIIAEYEKVDLKRLEAAAKYIFVKNNLFMGVSNNPDIIPRSQIRRFLLSLSESFLR